MDIKIDRARERYAKGVFDPVLTISASRESIQRPDNTANVNSADAVQQQRNQFQFISLLLKATRQPVPTFQDFTRGQIIVFDQDADRIESGVQFRTPLGTRLQISARQSKIRSTFDGDTRTTIPYFTAFGGLEVRQPLLKDFGPDANLADLRVAKINLKISELSWEKRLSDTAQQVMATYFDML